MSKKQVERPELNDVQNGPVMDRSCTDIICCFIFLASVIAMLVAAFMAYGDNKYQLVGAIVDPDGRACGAQTMKDYPIAFLEMPYKNVDYKNKTLDYIFKRRVCVSQCPENKTVTQLKCAPNSVVKSCKGVFNEQQASSTDNQLRIYSSSKLGTICFPKSETLDKIIEENFQQSSKASSLMSDAATSLENNKIYILISFFIAFAITILFLIFMRYCTGVVVWLSILTILALMVYGGYMMYTAGEMAMAIGIWVAAGLYLVIFICCNYQKIKMATAVFKAASRMVSGNLRLGFVPIIVSLVTLGFIMFWAISGVIFISRSLTYQKGDFITHVADYQSNQMIYSYYYFFCGLWVTEFIKTIGLFIIIAFSCLWYYNQQNQQEDYAPLSTSTKWAFFKHCGSIAFGSFFVAVIEFIRVILESVMHKAEQQAGQQNSVVKCMTSCARCCLACIQKIIECINRTAYTIIALKATKYCSSAATGIKLAMCNPMYMVILSGLGQIIQILGILLISFSNTIIFYYMSGLNNQSNVSSIGAPVLIVFLLSAIVASTFMSLYSTSADAMLICFFIDNEIENATKGNQKNRAPEEFKSLYEDM